MLKQKMQHSKFFNNATGNKDIENKDPRARCCWRGEVRAF